MPGQENLTHSKFLAGGGVESATSILDVHTLTSELHTVSKEKDLFWQFFFPFSTFLIFLFISKVLSYMELPHREEQRTESGEK